MVIPIVWQNSNGAVPPPAVDPSSLKMIAVGPTGIPPLSIPPPPQVDYDDPSWIEHPTSADVEASRITAIQHIGGEAILTCRIERDGSVSECRPRDETPAGSGFAAAAMTLATKFKAKPLEGHLIRSAVRIRVRYPAPSP